ncbi:MAG TPA: oligosaccharide flippase family protein [Kofleriaceae bacterium]|nr:oligosaccharide flippase family protein [Kofleriaceae bacterium]
MPSDSRQIRGAVNRGLAWIGLASALVGLFDVLSTILVFFWLSTHDYGVAMLAGSLFAVLDLATDLGLSSALIQRDDHTPERVSTVFWINLGLSALVAGVLVIGAPLLGRLQGEPMVGTILLIYGGKLIFHNIYFVPQALMKKELRFKELSAIRVAANLAELVVKVTAAALGAGVWFLLIGRAAHTVVTAIGIQARKPWRPLLRVRLVDSAAYLKFGLRTSASQILFHTYTNLDFQVVGYYFGASANAFYHLATTLVLQPVRMVSLVVIEVAFPAFARMRGDRGQLVEQLVRFTRLNLVTVLPVLAIIGLGAPDLVHLLWRDELMPAATAARILCLVGILRSMSFVLPPLLDGMGKPQLTLRYQATAAVMLTGLYVLFAELFGDQAGFLSVAMAWVAGYPIAFLVLAYLTMAQLELRARDYLRRIIGVIACIAAGGLVGAGVQWALRDAAPGLRLGVMAVAIVATTLALIGRFQGMTLSFLRRSLRGEP